MQFLRAGLAAPVKAERLVSTHLSFCPGVMFEAGRLHTLLGPPSGIELIVHQPMVGRFSAGCICPDSSVLTDYSSRLGHRCRHVRVHTDHNLLWQLVCALELCIMPGHAPPLETADGVVIRRLSDHLRVRSARAMTVLYARLSYMSFDRFTRLADRSFAVIETPMMFLSKRRRTKVPGKTALPLA